MSVLLSVLFGDQQSMEALPTSQGLAPLISRLIEDSSGRQALAF